MKKVVLYIAMSLDGYIADKNGSVEWLDEENSEIDNMGSFPEFYGTIDTVIMGYYTYNQIVTELSPDAWVYNGIKSYVLTNRNLESNEEVEFTNMDIADLIKRLKNSEGKNIWICGGADIANQLIKLDLIDRYHITMIPTILGSGLRLFDNDDSTEKLSLKLVSHKSYGGMVDLVYDKK